MDETTIDLKDIIRTLRKRRSIIINVFLGAIILATVISFLIPPTYEAETTLRIKQPKGLANSLLSDLTAGSGFNTKQLMSTYAEIIKSRTVVQDVIDKTQAGKEKIPTYEDMLKRITTQPVKDTEILKINITAKSPEEAELVANTLVESFVERLTTLTRSEQASVRTFIGERLQESKSELEKAESDLQKYKKEQKIVAPAEETKALVERLSTINKLVAENNVQAAASQAKLGNAREQLGREKAGFVADGPLIQQYKGKLAELEVQLVSLSEKYNDKHPDILATRAAIAETTKNLSVEAARIVNAEAPSMNPIHQKLLEGRIQAEVELAAAQAQKGALDSIINKDEQNLNKLPAKEQGLAKVMRNASVAQEIYVMLAKRFEEARISEVMQPTDVQVIDSAIAPEKPVSPKKTLNIIIAAVLGLFVGIGLAFILEFMNKSIRTARDVGQYLDLPVLGNIPNFDSETKKLPNNTSWKNIIKLFKKDAKRGM